MERQFYKNELYPDCPIRNILNHISDKWTLLVLYTLNGHEPMRFKDLSAELQDISQKMLVLTLRTLETDGFVARKVYAEVPPRVEYSLTDRAHSLFPIIDQLIQWAKDHMDEILFDRTVALNKNSRK
ncbi:helix-turn-helix domain-containing protein [uncultured Muribaculum sp.]|uniref:winged helix-turn-helix transcriptional regulator n=1 Tax=uncultured Muribaculum sp. TaxID=1918613 RepID=UPI002596613E|nr:helix-turn-helix domain-containing protein [uncultured Muribaculum sp.]